MITKKFIYYFYDLRLLNGINFIIQLLLNFNINFIKIKKYIVNLIILYYILLNSLLIQIKLYKYINIYYLKPL